MTDKERIEKLKKAITALLTEFDEETKGYYKIILNATKKEDLVINTDISIGGVDLNIQV